MSPPSINRPSVKPPPAPREREADAPRVARRARSGWVVGVLGVALVVWFAERKTERTQPLASTPKDEAPVLLSQAVLASAPPPESSVASRSSATPRGPKQQNVPPHILSATLDRSSLCPGESTWLRVSAEDADDSDLRYQARYFSPELGRPVFGFGRWVRYQAPRRPGHYEVVPFVTDPSGGRDSKTLGVTVEACEHATGFSANELVIGHRELDAQTHQFDLGSARRRAASAGKSFEVRGWRFGDEQRGDEQRGDEQRGDEQRANEKSGAGKLEVRHRYPVVLGQRYSYYLVQADVSIDGAPQRLEYGLTFYSYVAANLKGRYVALAADVERGKDDAQQIEYTVTFSNPTPFAAYARQYEQVCLDESGLPRLRRREPLDLTVPGDDALEQTFELNRAECPGGATYELFGETTGGYRTGGLWSYKFRPRRGPTNSIAARAQAREILSQQVSTDPNARPDPLH